MRIKKLGDPFEVPCNFTSGSLDESRLDTKCECLFIILYLPTENVHPGPLDSQHRVVKTARCAACIALHSAASGPPQICLGLARKLRLETYLELLWTASVALLRSVARKTLRKGINQVIRSDDERRRTNASPHVIETSLGSAAHLPMHCSSVALRRLLHKISEACTRGFWSAS